MSKIKDKYVRYLVEKLNEWGRNEELGKIIIDVYTTALICDGWCEDEILSLLEQTSDYFKDDIIFNCLSYEIMAIKVNGGY